MKVIDFVDTYNQSCSVKKDTTPLQTKQLENLYNTIEHNIRGYCKLEECPDFELDLFGRIVKLYGAHIV